MSGGSLQWLAERLAGFSDAPALIEDCDAGAQTTTYQNLVASVDAIAASLRQADVAAGDSVGVVAAEWSPRTAAAFFAAAQHGAIVVPITPATRDERSAVAGVQFLIDAEGSASIEPRGDRLDHPLYDELRASKQPGLVLFSSGTSGRPKAIVHDLEKLLAKFEKPHASPTTLGFMPWDHIGGLDVILYVGSGGGTLVMPSSRRPEAVAKALSEHGVALAPATPTFLNLLLLSGELNGRSFPDLRTIAYGAEAMPETTLRQLHAALPGVRFVQTFGMTELGAVRTESKTDDSLWLKIKSQDVQYRIVDGLLQIKAPTAMLGYLNAESPFTEDGWLITGDEAEIEGDYLRIYGRRSDLINVGGEKVHPAEVEDVLLQSPKVAEARVYGEPHALTGAIVCAEIVARDENTTDSRELIRAIKSHCRERLSTYKTPVKIKVVSSVTANDRFKKQRS